MYYIIILVALLFCLHKSGIVGNKIPDGLQGMLKSIIQGIIWLPRSLVCIIAGIVLLIVGSHGKPGQPGNPEKPIFKWEDWKKHPGRSKAVIVLCTSFMYFVIIASVVLWCQSQF